jgi:molybdopterin adenylyltransferase
LRIAVVTVSDRASRGVYADLSGPAIEEVLASALPGAEFEREIVPDDREAILAALARHPEAGWILTTGGTGPAPRDVTPEATEAVCEKMLPGFGEQMRAASLKFVLTAILSRQTSGIRGKSLILNLPGKPSSIDDCLNAVFPAIPYCIDLIEGAYLESDPAQCKVFRPAHAVRQK